MARLKLAPNPRDARVRELDVDITISPPQRHWAFRLFHHPGAQIFVGHEEQVFFFRRCIDDFYRVAAGANHVAERLHFGAAIDVGNRPEVRVRVLQSFQLVGGTIASSEQPASLSGNTTIFPGFKILAVSAMK